MVEKGDGEMKKPKRRAICHLEPDFALPASRRVWIDYGLARLLGIIYERSKLVSIASTQAVGCLLWLRPGWIVDNKALLTSVKVGHKIPQFVLKGGSTQ